MWFFALILLSFTTQNSYTKDNLHTLYAHGIVDSSQQAKRFAEAIATDQKHTHAVNFADTQKETGYGINRAISEITTLTKKPVNRSKMYMGQRKDLETIHQELQKIPAQSDIILYGCSRGGAALVTYLGKQHPQNIKALILDASPASMPSTTHPLLAKIGIPFTYDTSIFTTLFPAYPCNATAPLQAIKYINDKKMPILLLHSETDTKVPFAHSLKLYLEFKKQGFEYVYLVRIPNGKHSFLLQDNAAKNAYLTAVHSFYKTHNLPYNQEYAHANMKQYQPDETAVLNEIKTFESKLLKQYENSKTRNISLAALTALLISASWYYKQKQKNLINTLKSHSIE